MAKVTLIIEDAEHNGAHGITISQEWDPPLHATKDGIPVQPTIAQHAAYHFLQAVGMSSDEVVTLEDVSVPLSMAVVKGGKSNGH